MVSNENAVYLPEDGINFTHRALGMEPLNGAPETGVPANFSEGTYMYRVHSADGTTCDWRILMVVQ